MRSEHSIFLSHRHRSPQREIFNLKLVNERKRVAKESIPHERTSDKLDTSRLPRKKLVRVFSQIASERVTSVRERSRRKMQKSFGRKKDVLVARCSSWYPRTHYAYECKAGPFGRPRASQRLFVTQWHGRTYTRHTLDNRGRYERRAYLRTIHTCSRRSRSQFQPFRFPSTASAASADDSSCFPLFFPLLSTLHHPRLPLARISTDLDDRVPCHDYLPPSSLGLRDFCPAYRAPRPATCCLSTGIFLSIVQLYSTFFKLSTSVRSAA